MAAEATYAGEDRIGGFRYIRTIHPGATTMVLEVIQESTKRRFALKQMLESRASAEDRKRFAFEAKLGMQLFHPNLIRVKELHPQLGLEREPLAILGGSARLEHLLQRKPPLRRLLDHLEDHRRCAGMDGTDVSKSADPILA